MDKSVIKAFLDFGKGALGGIAIGLISYYCVTKPLMEESYRQGHAHGRMIGSLDTNISWLEGLASSLSDSEPEEKA